MNGVGVSGGGCFAVNVCMWHIRLRGLHVRDACRVSDVLQWAYVVVGMCVPACA